MLCSYKPAEVIYDRSDNMDPKVLALMKSTSQVTAVAGQKSLDMLQGIAFFKRYFSSGSDFLKSAKSKPARKEAPEALVALRTNQYDKAQSWAAFALMVYYLQKNLIAEQIIPLAEYDQFEMSSGGYEHMVLNSTAI